MLETITFLKNNLAEHFVIYFIPLYILGGRPVAILSEDFFSIACRGYVGYASDSYVLSYI